MEKELKSDTGFILIYCGAETETKYFIFARKRKL
jgi:hypothetical protein